MYGRQKTHPGVLPQRQALKVAAADSVQATTKRAATVSCALRSPSARRLANTSAAWRCAPPAASTSRPVMRSCKASRTNIAASFSGAMATATPGQSPHLTLERTTSRFPPTTCRRAHALSLLRKRAARLGYPPEISMISHCGLALSFICNDLSLHMPLSEMISHAKTSRLQDQPTPAGGPSFA